jgi:hypothetical protein
MGTANVSRMHRTNSELQAQVDDEIAHIRNLVFVRNLLEARGAERDELAECDAVIDGLRRQLADAAKRASAPLAA